MRLRQTLLAAAAAAAAFAAAPASAAVMEYRANLKPLNNSGVTGVVNFTLDTSMNMLGVRVRASGLAPNTPHMQHIHGRFADVGCETRAPANGGPVSGACLDSATTIESNIPTLANDDFDGDGFLETVEGAPAYGPIILNLAEPGTMRSNLMMGFPMSDADGNLFFEAMYDLGAEDMDGMGLLFDSLNNIEHEIGDLFDLMTRVFVLHGMRAGPGGNGFEVTPDTAPGQFVGLLPAAAAEIEQVPEPGAIALLGLGALGLGIARRRRKA